jgi:hypothetical protein
MSCQLTPAVERLWFDFCKAGYNGHQMKRVILYLQDQLRQKNPKRNEGCLTLSALLSPDSAGVLRFAVDLGLAERRLRPATRLAPLPEGEAPAAPLPHAGEDAAAGRPASTRTAPTAKQLLERKAEWDRVKAELGRAVAVDQSPLDARSRANPEAQNLLTQ